MAQRSKAPNIDNEQGLRCWTHLVGDSIDARTWSDTPSSSSHAEGIVLDCGHRTATRRIEECTIVDNCSFNVIGGVVSTRACQAQPAGLDVAAAQCGTGGFILDACGPARPVLAACRACEAWLRELAGRESSHREDTRAGVKYRGCFFFESSNFALRRSFGTQRDLSCYREHSADTVRCVFPSLSDRPI